MKLLLVLSLGCLLVHQASAACTKVIILMDAPPANPPVLANGCPSCQYLQLTQTSYNSTNTLGLTMNDALVLIPSTATIPTAVTVTTDYDYIRNLAANTNLYVMTYNIPATTYSGSNGKIIQLGQAVPTVHVVDYYAYLTATGALAPAAGTTNPCSFLASAPPTLAGNCAFPCSKRVVILTDDYAPYPNLATSCLGSCSFYNTGMYNQISMLGLTKNDALFIQPSVGTLVTSASVIANKDYLNNLAAATNVYILTSGGAGNVGSNTAITTQIIAANYPNVIVKDYTTYTCTQVLFPGVSCVCRYVSTLSFAG